MLSSKVQAARVVGREEALSVLPLQESSNQSSRHCDQYQGRMGTFTNWANGWNVVALGGGNGIMKLVYLNLESFHKAAAWLLKTISQNRDLAGKYTVRMFHFPLFLYTHCEVYGQRTGHWRGSG